jgi:hypothetical protein
MWCKNQLPKFWWLMAINTCFSCFWIYGPTATFYVSYQLGTGTVFMRSVAPPSGISNYQDLLFLWEWQKHKKTIRRTMWFLVGLKFRRTCTVLCGGRDSGSVRGRLLSLGMCTIAPNLPPSLNSKKKSKALSPTMLLCPACIPYEPIS